MKLLYDVTIKKVGCPLLQTVHGCHESSRFPVESWFIHPTPDMRVYEISISEFNRLLAFHRIAASLNVDSFTCPVCGITSFNVHDIENRYCANCKEFIP